MGGTSACPELRRHWDGVAEVVRFNWPRYVAGLVVVCASVWIWWSGVCPGWGDWIVGVGGVVAAWWMLASLLVTHWIYDCSGLRLWDWLRGCLGSEPQRWVNIHSGFDETSESLRRVFPAGQGTTIDLYDPSRMTERSVHRARLMEGDVVRHNRISPGALPLKVKGVDTVFLLLAAHELRAAVDREALFRELWRSVSESGSVIVVEHTRDLWNFAAYGPGITHFYPAREWRRLGRLAGFALSDERHITPFVRCFVFRKECASC